MRGVATGTPPCARGNPIAVVDARRQRMIVFGGWDGERRYADVHALDLTTWHWERQEPSGSGPKARTDHAAALWEGGDALVVNGGATVDGPANDTWLLHLGDWRCAGSPRVALLGHRV